MVKCAFCQREGDWISILRDPSIVMPDDSDVILCDECMNHYANGDDDKIKLPKIDKDK